MPLGVTTIHIHRAVMRSFQEIESRQVQNQPAAGTKDAMHFVERERVIHAGGLRTSSERTKSKEFSRKGKFVHARGNQLRAGLAPGRKFQGMLALIYSG